LNGKPAIIFDGSNDFLEASTASDWEFLHFGTGHTNFGVARAGNVTDPEALYIIFGTTSTVTRRGAYLGHDTRTSQSRDRVLVHVIGNADINNGIVSLNTQPSASTPANTQFLHYLLGKPDNSTLSERSAIATNSGSLTNANTSNNVSASGNPNHPLVFGMSRNASNTPQFYLAGAIQEQIFYNFDQSTNRTVISANINTYYAIY
jgi:hypothetical protein